MVLNKTYLHTGLHKAKNPSVLSDIDVTIEKPEDVELGRSLKKLGIEPENVNSPVDGLCHKYQHTYLSATACCLSV